MPPRCPGCGGGRIVRHRNLVRQTIAHIDCDAFYASVEKRDRPELQGRPVIVGGGTRGVVTAACYVARIYGVKSAMPMFKALKACPDAVVIKPDFSKYIAASRQMRALMSELTPLVQPLSIDEAVLDLAGTEALHGAAPAVVLARFANAVETQIGVTVSIGLAANRLMARSRALPTPSHRSPEGTFQLGGNRGHFYFGLTRARGRSIAESQVGQRRNDVRSRPYEHPGPGTSSLAPLRKARSASERTRTRGRRCGAEAKDRTFRLTHPVRAAVQPNGTA